MEKKVRKKRKLGSFPFLSVVLSTTLALFVIGLFGVMVLHASRLTTLIQENIEIQVFLNKDTPSSEINRISRTIESKPYALKKETGSPVRLITREEAAQQFVNETGEDFRDFLGDNPLRDLLVVNIQPGYQSADSLRLIKTEIEQMRGVFEVSYVESLVESIQQNLTKIGALLIGFFIILLLVVIILINNTIKLALFSQRFLIRSMQLVGATGRFIRRPFLGRAVLYGFVAGLLAISGLYAVLVLAYRRIEDLQLLRDENSFLLLCGGILITGMLVGYLSTWRAMRKYLNMSLDELY